VAPGWLRQRRWRRLLYAIGLAGLLGLAIWAIAGSTSQLTEAKDALTRIEPGYLGLAAAAEAASFVAYAQGQRTLLRAARRAVPLLPMTGIVTAAQALANCLPAGIAASTIYTFRQLLRRRIGVLVSGEVQIAQTLLYMATLAVLALAGAEIAGSGGTVQQIPDLQYIAFGLLGLTVLVIAAGAWLHRRGADLRAWRWLARRIASDPAAADRMIAGAGELSPTRGEWVSAALWTGGSWVLDCGCLAAGFLAVGSAPPMRGLLLAYCAGQLANVIPISIGGLGVVEESLTAALVIFGGAEGNTLAAVLLYRLFSYWAVFPAGLTAHLLIRRRHASAAAAEDPVVVPT